MIAALFDHLWQSTLFACAAGLLVLALRRHSARARYWVWFAASVKFLIPFSLLESAGSWLAPRAEAPVVSQPIADAVNWISTPFLAAIAPTSPSAATHPLAAAHALPATHPLTATVPTAAVHVASQLLPHMTAWLATAWLAGTIVVVAVWAVRWTRLFAVVRMARTAEMAAPVPVKVTSARIEPGLVGIARPVLLLPDGLAAHLSAQEVNCLIAHEVSHLRRRDNLTAAIHMIVEAVFWFYPLTWWLGTRLIAERERACDESVLASGHDPETYAAGILKVCRFYIQAPLACTAGVSGADLKKRIEVIVSRPAVRRMSAATRLAIMLAGIAGVAGPVLYGLVSAPAIAAAAQAGAQAPSPAAAPSGAAMPGSTAASSAGSSPSAAEIARLRYEQSRPQKEVPFNPTDFDKFAGYYRFGDTDSFARVYRTGNRYFSQLTGQPPAELFPESPTEFFLTVVAAQTSFVIGRDGRVTGMVIHQNGMLHPLHRVSEAEFNAASAALAQRIKANRPSPGTRAMVLSYIKGLQQGHEDFDTMTPPLAAAARAQFTQAEATVRKQGTFESLAFARVLPNGANVFIATFARGEQLWLITPLTRDGKVGTLFFRPYPP